MSLNIFTLLVSFFLFCSGSTENVEPEVFLDVSSAEGSYIAHVVIANKSGRDIVLDKRMVVPNEDGKFDYPPFTILCGDESIQYSGRIIDKGSKNREQLKLKNNNSLDFDFNLSENYKLHLCKDFIKVKYSVLQGEGDVIFLMESNVEKLK